MESDDPTPSGDSRGLEDLPEEIIEFIMFLVSPYRDLKSLSLVSTTWLHRTQDIVRRIQSAFVRAVCDRDVVWTRLTTWESISPRYGHSACVHGDSMFVFGGCTATSTTFNDLWQLDLSRREWSRPMATGNYPSPKALASMLVHGDRLVLFGGWTQPSPYPFHQSFRMYNQLHVYDVAANRWTEILSPVLSPPPMAGHSATVHNDTMVVFGGLRRFDEGGKSNDVWLLDLATNSWRLLKPTTGVRPEPRYGQSQIRLDESNLLIIGGCGGSNQLFTDAWLLNLEIACWQELRVDGIEHAAPFLWCLPVVPVSRDYAVVVSQESRHRRYSSDKPPDFRQRPAPLPARNDRPRLEPSPRPTLPTAFAHNTAQPSVRPNATRNRQRQLESLRRMEQRIHRLSQGEPKDLPSPFLPPTPPETNPPQPPPATSHDYIGNPARVYVVHIGEALTAGKVTWLPHPVEAATGRLGAFVPEYAILHSLVRGRGELVMFGGVQKDSMSATTQWTSPDVQLSNSTFVMTAVKSVA